MNQEEQLLETGEAAEIVLAQPAFNQVINGLVERSFQTFVNTKPEETGERERAYSHYRALVDVVETLKQQVSIRDEILAKGDTRQEEAQDHE
mgnify:CR=1 FL=1|jgi:hypothetical protein